MPAAYEHIRLQRESDIRERRGKSVPPPKFTGKPSEHAQKLGRDIYQAREDRLNETQGFDNRLLLKLDVRDNFEPASFEAIPGIEVVSQENTQIVLLFATEEGLTEFESRLSTFGSTGSVTRKDIIEATRSIALWTPEDRKGEALKHEILPSASSLILDVELWPLEKVPDRARLLNAFKAFIIEKQIEFVDSVSNDYLNIVRVRCRTTDVDLLLHHRDVRTVDLPPKFFLDATLLQQDISQFSEPNPPRENAPRVAILDSGLNAAHPLLKNAVGETRTYIKNSSLHDEVGHGTAVASIALYNDVTQAIEAKSFQPQFWLLSGKVLNQNNEFDEKLIENQISQAVREFHAEYGCRIFCVALGNERRPYAGGRVGSFTVTLDNLSHELGVLFILPTGNYSKSCVQENIKYKQGYPHYLFKDGSILEPSNSLNAITVGSLSRYEQGREAARYPTDPAYQPVARFNEISPFSRIGPGVLSCIKPELVAYGGNLSVERGGSIREHGLGEVAFSHNFADGKLFAELCGTSAAAPKVAHLAGRLAAEINNPSIHLIRCLLIAHATEGRVNYRSNFKKVQRRRLAGYGHIDEDFLYRSGEETVVLYASDSIENNKNHFYELPIPDEYYKGKRKREITVALSYFSYVKNTRVTYRASRCFFRLVQGRSLDEIVHMFDKATPKDDYSNIEEYKNNRRIGATERSKGTVQASTWELKGASKPKNFYLVVTRNDNEWGKIIAKPKEEYAIAVVVRDRENQNATLYTRIREAIRERIRRRV